jgi:hypothetical protein
LYNKIYCTSCLRAAHVCELPTKIAAAVCVTLASAVAVAGELQRSATW